jgi:hypothetical protein
MRAMMRRPVVKAVAFRSAQRLPPYFRRLAVRYDRSLAIYQAFFHVACLAIILPRVLK